RAWHAEESRRSRRRAVVDDRAAGKIAPRTIERVGRLSGVGAARAARATTAGGAVAFHRRRRAATREQEQEQELESNRQGPDERDDIILQSVKRTPPIVSGYRIATNCFVLAESRCAFSAAASVKAITCRNDVGSYVSCSEKYSSVPGSS